jgi:hypothetical protein
MRQKGKLYVGMSNERAILAGFSVVAQAVYSSSVGALSIRVLHFAC